MSPTETRPVTNPKVVDRRPDADELERPGWLPHDRWPFVLRRYRHRKAGQTIDIHYTDEGHGPVLLFVHVGMWSFIWRDVIERLRRDFRCISLDFPGAGSAAANRTPLIWPPSRPSSTACSTTAVSIG